MSSKWHVVIQTKPVSTSPCSVSPAFLCNLQYFFSSADFSCIQFLSSFFLHEWTPLSAMDPDRFNSSFVGNLDKISELSGTSLGVVDFGFLAVCFVCLYHCCVIDVCPLLELLQYQNAWISEIGHSIPEKLYSFEELCIILSKICQPINSTGWPRFVAQEGENGSLLYSGTIEEQTVSLESQSLNLWNLRRHVHPRRQCKRNLGPQTSLLFLWGWQLPWEWREREVLSSASMISS